MLSGSRSVRPADRPARPYLVFYPPRQIKCINFLKSAYSVRRTNARACVQIPWATLSHSLIYDRVGQFILRLFTRGGMAAAAAAAAPCTRPLADLKLAAAHFCAMVMLTAKCEFQISARFVLPHRHWINFNFKQQNRLWNGYYYYDIISSILSTCIKNSN